MRKEVEGWGGKRGRHRDEIRAKETDVLQRGTNSACNLKTAFSALCQLAKTSVLSSPRTAGRAIRRFCEEEEKMSRDERLASLSEETESSEEG